MWFWRLWHILFHESPRGHRCRGVRPDDQVSMPHGWSESSYFRYQREHLSLRLTLRSLNNHELRELLIGLWSRLDRDDQADHIRELQHYFAGKPGTFLSGIAKDIRDA